MIWAVIAGSTSPRSTARVPTDENVDTRRRGNRRRAGFGNPRSRAVQAGKRVGLAEPRKRIVIAWTGR